MSKGTDPLHNCDSMQELLAQRLDAELAPELVQELELHLVSCRSCRELAGYLQQIDALALASSNLAPEPAHFAQLSDRIAAAISARQSPTTSGFRRAEPRWRWPRWSLPVLVPSAALALLLVLLLDQDPAAPTPTRPPSEAIADAAPAPAAEPRSESQLESKDPSAHDGPTRRPNDAEKMEVDLLRADSGSKEAEPSSAAEQPAEAVANRAQGATTTELSQSKVDLDLLATVSRADDALVLSMLRELRQTMASEVETGRKKSAPSAQPMAKAAAPLLEASRLQTEALAPTHADSIRSYLRSWLTTHPDHALADSVRAVLK